MSFSRVSLFGVLATTTAVSARINPSLGGEDLEYLGFSDENKLVFAPSNAFSLGPVPSSMLGFEVWRQDNPGKNWPANTPFTITCDNPKVGGDGGLCEMFVSVHSCAACTSKHIDGGLKEALKADGWTNAPCASVFSIGDKKGLKMQTVRKQLVDGESMTVMTTGNLCHIAVYQKKATVDCAAQFSDVAKCDAAFACNWDVRSNSCGSAFCPAPVGPHPPVPCTCAV